MQRRVALLSLAALPWGTGAQGLSLAGHMGHKALLVVDGQTVMLAVGESRFGVRLLSIEAGRARVEQGGRISELQVGQAPARLDGAAPADGGAREIVLTVGSGGHFLASGAINNRPVRFMVDTGASVVALDQAQADRIGLAYRNGRRVTMQTANGSTPARLVTLTAVTLGGITVANVQAVVMPAPMPHVLLGNSFLQRFQMRRENDLMRLELR